MELFKRKPAFTEADVESLKTKMASPEASHPGGFIEVTNAEFAVLRSAQYQRLNFGKLD